LSHALCDQIARVETRRPVGLRHPSTARAERHESARIGQHLASVELGYFGDTFWRPFDEPLPWLDEGAAPNADMWATAAESRQEIVGLYQRVWHHADITIGSLALDSVGRVPWWPPDRSKVTLHRLEVRMRGRSAPFAWQC
jgi:hypothetical protein